MRGWVYVMTCRAMPGLLKVGASSKDPFIRTKELRSTGNPHDFVVEYDSLVDDPFMLERAVHERLAHYQERGDGQGAEFFRCTVEEAVMAIRSLTRGASATDTFHKVERAAVLAAEKARVEHLEALRRDAEDQRNRQQDEAKRHEAEKVARQLREEQERERSLLDEARIERRNAWDADQKDRLYKVFKEKLIRAKGAEMLTNGTLIMCPSCSRPLLSSTPIEGEIECDACHSRISVPVR